MNYLSDDADASAGDRMIGGQKDRVFRILLADDNPIDRRVIEAALSKSGFSVRLVSDGNEALAEHLKTPFDLILMDCQMPNMDGFEATRCIRLLDLPQPVILAVAAEVLQDREKCLEAGMNGYVTKPIVAPELLQVVKRALKLPG